MKFVLIYQPEVNYECCCGEVVLPVEYESVEALLCDFDQALMTAVNMDSRKWSGDFQFAKKSFYIQDFFINNSDGMTKRKYTEENKQLPEVLTIDEWFTRSNINP